MEQRKYPRMDSEYIADRMGIQHTNFRIFLYSHLEQLEKYDTVIFTKKPGTGKGRPKEVAFLTLRQVGFLLMMTKPTETSKTFKEFIYDKLVL